MRGNPESLRQKIEDLLIALGGHTISDLVAEFPQHTLGGISKTVCDLRDAGLVFVEDWVYDAPGSKKKHPRPVWNHVKNSKRKRPVNKARPLPEGNAARLKKRRINRGGAVVIARYMFKLVKPTPLIQDECSTVEQKDEHAA